MSFFAELKRRNVVRVGIAYAVAGWLVLQLTEVLSELLNLPESIGPIVVTVVAIGLPIALVFAWAYELTPEGIKKERDVDRSQSITSQTGRKLDFVIIGVLVIALTYFIADKFFIQPGVQQQADDLAQQQETAASEMGLRTIAVLPLVNMSADAENEYFSDGLTEELLNILAKIQDLRVAGRTSSFAFKGKNEDLREIAEKLNVETLLEGSVRKSGERVRITLQLINAEDGYHLWSETYDRNLDDIFAIQEEVAHEVAAALRVTLLGEDEARLAAQPTTSLTAYEHYLHGLEQLNEYSYTSLPEALTSFRAASALDPEFLPAVLHEADTLLHMQTTGLMSRMEAVELAEPLVQRVLDADPDSDEALSQMGRVLVTKRENEKGREFYRRALDINPRNVMALARLGRNYANWGELDQGLALLEEAERIDPYNPELLWDLAFTHAIQQDTAGVDRHADRIADLEPENANPYWGKALVRWLNGDVAEAQMYQIRGHEIDPQDYEFQAGIADMWLDLGDVEQADQWLERATEMGANEPVPLMVQILMAQYREQRALAVELARGFIEAGLDNRQGAGDIARQVWVTSLLDQGRADEARAYYETELPLAFQEAPDFQLDVPFGAIRHLEAALVLIALDPDSPLAAELLDAAERKIKVRSDQHLPTTRFMHLASVAAARGDKTQALELLEQSIERGLSAHWRHHLVDSLLFQSLHDDADYLALVARVESNMAEQRELAYRLLEQGP